MKGTTYVVIPSVDKGGKLVDAGRREEVVRTVERALALDNGGCTRVDGIGTWMGSAGWVTERVTRLESWGMDAPDHRSALGRWVRAQLNQEAVIVGFNPGSAEFV